VEEYRRPKGQPEAERESHVGDDPRDLPQLDPDAPPAKPNEERPSPERPLKDQGDPLDSR
jgi:hypothetical protein